MSHAIIVGLMIHLKRIKKLLLLCHFPNINHINSSTLVDFKVIRFDPLAPVKTTALLLSVEWEMPDSISNNEYLESICKKFIKAFGNNDFG